MGHLYDSFLYVYQRVSPFYLAEHLFFFKYGPMIVYILIPRYLCKQMGIAMKSYKIYHRGSIAAEHVTVDPPWKWVQYL